MTQQPTASEQYQGLINQEAALLTAKARLLEQLETTTAAINQTRAALQGIQLGAAVAAERTAEALKTAEAEPQTSSVSED